MSFMRNRQYYQNAVSLTRADRHLTREELETVAPSTYAEDAHASRSDRYGHVNTRDVIRALWTEGFAPHTVQQARVRTHDRAGFQKHMIKFQRRSDALTVLEAQQVGDTRAEVVLVNSHDGTSSFQAYGGLFRLICLNGMVVGEQVQSIRVPHTVNAVQGVVEAVVALAEQTRQTFAHIDAMKSTQLSREARIAFANVALALRYGADLSPFSAEAILRPMRTADVGTDLWSTFNVVQEHIIRGGDRAYVPSDNGRRHRRVTSREVTGIDQNLGLNRALWDAAAERIAA